MPTNVAGYFVAPISEGTSRDCTPASFWAYTEIAQPLRHGFASVTEVKTRFDEGRFYRACSADP